MMSHLLYLYSHLLMVKSHLKTNPCEWCLKASRAFEPPLALPAERNNSELSKAISGTQIGGTYHIYIYILFFRAKFQGIYPQVLWPKIWHWLFVPPLSHFHIPLPSHWFISHEYPMNFPSVAPWIRILELIPIPAVCLLYYNYSYPIWSLYYPILSLITPMNYSYHNSYPIIIPYYP